MRAAANHGLQKRGQLEDARRGELSENCKRAGKVLARRISGREACFSFAASKRRSKCLLVVSPLFQVLLESKIEATSVFEMLRGGVIRVVKMHRKRLPDNDFGRFATVEMN
jgi:hypothetical protein